ncbi:MAG: DUF2807 domain-containing protein [Desulfobacterales bacterium]|nr:MAG: DUF2807 domain-containing protein [Desulfobacterales bacterium]
MDTRLSRLLMVLILGPIFASGCIVIELDGCAAKAVRGSGNVVSEDRPVPEFNQISLKGSGNVFLTKGAKPALVIKTDDNILPLIEAGVRSAKLVISQRKNVRPTTLDFFITVTDLNGVAISGSGNVTGESRFVADKFDAQISGSGDIALDLEVAKLQSGIAGSGSLTLGGQADYHEASITGSGAINAFEMKAKKVFVSITGSGDCKVNASEALQANITGSGDVYYMGHPQIDSTIKGSGSLKSQK